jgi:hypothetical protein
MLVASIAIPLSPCQVHLDSYRSNHVTQEWYFLDLELTLAELGVQLVLS